MSVTEREYRQAQDGGAAARRGGRRIGDCPYRGHTDKVRLLAEAWRGAWQAEDARRKG